MTKSPNDIRKIESCPPIQSDKPEIQTPPEAHYRRPELEKEFKAFWAEIDAEQAAAEAKEPQERERAELFGFSHPVDLTQGTSFEEARAWTIGVCGHNNKGYKTPEGFYEWLENREYPYLDLGRITRKGFAIILERDQIHKRAQKIAWKKRHRKTTDLD